MIKIKTLHLKNYCGYRDTTINFTHNGEINNLSVLFGPNGTGKSTLLEAIQLLSVAKRFQEMDVSVLFRKLVFHRNYDPTYPNLNKPTEHMEISGIFHTPDGDKEVILSSKDGVVKNELPYSSYGHSYFIDADHPIEMGKFQLHEEMSEVFLNMARNVYGLDCNISKLVNALGQEEIIENGRIKKTGEYFYTDLIVDKGYYGKIHFKRMSDGEKKIATFLKDLCNPEYIQNIDIILADNLEMHVYWRRHPLLIDMLLRTFPDKQFIITTHSGVMIKHIAEKYGKHYLYDLEEIKKTELQEII